MIELSSGWSATTEQGPGWLFVRLRQPATDTNQAFPLAEQVWEMLQQQFTYRLVLEMDEIKSLRSPLIGQLMLLRKRIAAHGGMMRLSNLSEAAAQSLHANRLDGLLPHYPKREDAVMGRYRPPQPR